MKKVAILIIALAMIIAATAICAAASPVGLTITNNSKTLYAELVLTPCDASGKVVKGAQKFILSLAPNETINYGNLEYSQAHSAAIRVYFLDAYCGKGAALFATQMRYSQLENFANAKTVSKGVVALGVEKAVISISGKEKRMAVQKITLSPDAKSYAPTQF